MGNCFVGGALPAHNTYNKRETPSVASTASAVGVSTLSPLASASLLTTDGSFFMPSPISLDFVIKGESTVEDRKLSSDILRVVHGPQSSFVVLNPETGLVLVSVSRVGPKNFSVSTPDGRLVGTLLASRPAGGLTRKTFLEFSYTITSACGSIKGVRDDKINSALRLSLLPTKGSSSFDLCQVIDDRFVGSIHRGTDIVIVCVFSTVASLVP